MKKRVEIQCMVFRHQGVLFIGYNSQRFPITVNVRVPLITLLTRNVQGLRIVLLFATTVAKLMQFSGGALFCHVYYFHLPWSFFTFFLYYLTPLQDTARWVSHKFVVAIN